MAVNRRATPSGERAHRAARAFSRRLVARFCCHRKQTVAANANKPPRTRGLTSAPACWWWAADALAPNRFGLICNLADGGRRAADTMRITMRRIERRHTCNPRCIGIGGRRWRKASESRPFVFVVLYPLR